MKTDLIELMKGKSLKSQIYNSISKNKISHVGKLLKNAINSQLSHQSAPKYIDLKSEITEIKTEYSSPPLKETHSFKNFSKSVNESWNDHHHKSSSRMKANNCKSGEKNEKYTISKSKSKSKEKCRSLILKKSSICGQKMVKNISKSQLLTVSRQKQSRQKHKVEGQSKLLRVKDKTNLEEIIEQSSSEEKIYTPSHKKSHLTSRSPKEHTKKKEKSERFSESFKRRLCRSFKQPETFQKILKNEALTVGYRILKKKIIEIEIYAVKPILSLNVTLQKGNLQCQNIQESYKNVSANTLLALFSSVRHFNFDQINEFPRICIEATLPQNEKIERTILLPYTWLHFVENKLPSVKKSKIKTKLCLSDLAIASTKLNILSEIFHVWSKKTIKGHSQFQTGFCYEEHQFSLKLYEETNDTFTLELQGKGEQRLTSMISFLRDLIC